MALDTAADTEEDHADSGDLALELLSSISAIRRRMRRSPPPPGMSSTQAELLRLIYYQPELSAAKLASTLHVAPNTISSLLRQLTDHGYVNRRHDPTDLRLAFFEVTTIGKEYVIAARDYRLAALAAALDELTPEAIAALTEAAPALRMLAEQIG